MDVKNKPTAVFGDFDIGLEVIDYCNQEMNLVEAFTDIGDSHRFLEWCQQRIEPTQIVLALSDNAQRAMIYSKIADNKQLSFPNILLTNSFYMRGEDMGVGNIILMDSVVGVHTKLGNFNIIDIGACVMPGCIIKDFNYIDKKLNRKTMLGNGSEPK